MTETELKAFENKIRQDMLNELYTAIWQTPVRLVSHKAMLLNFVEEIANGHGLSIEEKIKESFKEEAIIFRDCLLELVRCANIHISSLNENYINNKEWV